MIHVNALAGVRVDRSADGEILVLDRHSFRALLAAAVRNVFDENWYLSCNPDVKASVKSGALKSGFDHFLDDGFFEGRAPCMIEVNESFYLEKYKDVAEAIRRKVVDNAKSHFESYGMKEGRLPFKDFSYFG